jgi:hypothetical protein
LPRVKRISREVDGKNYYLVDACFLANKYIPVTSVRDQRERARVQRSQEWWDEIDIQLRAGKALVYVPDICIAEAFKVLAKKYYVDHYFRYPVNYKRARDQLSRDIRVTQKQVKSANRNIKFHDISTSRDLIVAVDRFFEIFLKHGLNVSLPDLLILSVSKHLIDFYGLPRKRLFIITLDNALWRGSAKFADVPTAFNPTRNLAERVFE